MKREDWRYRNVDEMYAADIFISRLFIHHQSPRDCCRLAWATPWKHCTRQRSGRQLLRIQQVIHSQLTSKPTVETFHIAFYYVLLLELEILPNINSLGMSIQISHVSQAHIATPWCIYNFGASDSALMLTLCALQMLVLLLLLLLYCHQQQRFKYLHFDVCIFPTFLSLSK